ncbi:hypothetical protein JXA80_08730 [bacterium]|nr:hypothetical protein [candidate division CSSED10-310 bacterium]
MAKIWEEKDNEFLKTNYMKYSNQELAEMFDVTKKSIQGKLRRLGLHRRDDVPVEKKRITLSFAKHPRDDQSDEKPIFRRKRLNYKVPEAKPVTPPSSVYKPMEMTQKRERAMRELDNAMQVLSEGGRDQALEEFRFIKEKFPRELDIVQKAELWISVLTRPPEIEPQTAEEHYSMGIRMAQKNRLDKAQIHFRKAVEMDESYLDARYNLACIACKQGDHVQAIQMLADIGELDERFIETATLDEDFEPVWDNDIFIDLVMQFFGESEDED